MATSLSNLVDSLSEGLRNYKCTDCKSCLEYMSTEDKLLIFCCLKCNKNHKKPFNKCLIKRFANTYEFCGGDISKFCLMLRKAVYPYEYMNAWEKFNEKLFPNKEDFFSSQNIVDITDAIYKHAKKYGNALK